MIVVFDIDGTIADNSKREAIAHRASAAGKAGIPSGPIWDEFHEHIPDDKPILPICSVLDALAHRGERIEIWTARPEKYKPQTLAWLHNHDISYEKVRMRADGDWRKAYILKLEWFLTSAERPDLVFEDHPETTRLLRAAGAVVAQVGEGHNA